MAGSARQIVIEFLGKDKSLGSAVSSADRKTSKLGGTLKKVGLLAAGLLAGAAIIAGKALFDMTKNAAEDEAGQRRLAVALRNTARATDEQVKSVEDWIARMAIATGVADDEMRPAFQRLVQATNDIGEAQKLMKVALDASAGSGKSLEAVTTAMSKAANGNMGALSRLGIQIKDTEGKTLTFNQVVREMARTFKGQAEARAQSFDGKMRRLKLVLDETKEAIGARLIPMLSRLATWFLQKGLPAMQRFGNWMRNHLGPIFQSIANTVNNRVIPALSRLHGWYVNKIVPALQRSVKPALASLRDLIDRVSAKLDKNRSEVQSLQTAFRKLAEFIANHVSPVLGKFASRNLVIMAQALGAFIDYLARVTAGLIMAKNAVEDLSRAIRNIPHPSIPKIPGGIPGIPGLATGTPNFRGGAAIVGERGPELVTLPRGSAVTPNHRLRMAAGDDRPIVLQVLLDGRVIEQALVKRERDSGRPLAFRVRTS